MLINQDSNQHWMKCEKIRPNKQAIKHFPLCLVTFLRENCKLYLNKGYLCIQSVIGLALGTHLRFPQKPFF